MFRNLLLLLSSVGDASVQHCRKTRLWNVHLLCTTSRWHRDKLYGQTHCLLVFCFTITLYQDGGKKASFSPPAHQASLFHRQDKLSERLRREKLKYFSVFYCDYGHVDSTEITANPRRNPQFAEVSKALETQHCLSRSHGLCAGARVPYAVFPTFSSSCMLQLLCHQGSFISLIQPGGFAIPLLPTAG